MNRPLLLLCLTGTLLLTACHGSERTATGAARAGQGRVDVLPPSDRDADDAARFLAGLPCRDGSPYKPLESDAAWTAHAKRMDEAWARFEQRRKPGMDSFQRNELSDTSFRKSVIWYPFSGGDALTMLTYFPGHATYVMAALEPPGMVPRAHEFEAQDLSQKLPAIASTLDSLLSKSFFVTREMDHQLRGQVTDGVAEPILILLARMGYRILNHSYIVVDEQGRIVPREGDSHRAAFGRNRGLSLEIQRDGESKETLYYVSLNLDNNHMRDNPGFKAYVASLGGTETMLKATSYMLHGKTFSQIRDLILASSGLIVQDDSGIPWQYFTPENWQVQLYGDYEKPYGKDFQFRNQPDLHAAYEAQRKEVKELNFRVGYGSGHVISNLQVARRKH